MVRHFPRTPGQGRMLIRRLIILEACQPQPNSRQRHQLNGTVGHSPFAGPGSQAGASAAPATLTEVPSASISPFPREREGSLTAKSPSLSNKI